jgi:hypothetical protein
LAGPLAGKAALVFTTSGGPPEPPGTGEYTWDTWYANISFDLLAFVKIFPYYFFVRPG